MSAQDSLKKLDLVTSFDVEISEFRLCFAEKVFWFLRPLKKDELHLLATGAIELPPQIILAPTQEVRKQAIKGLSNKIVVITPDTAEAQIVDIFTDDSGKIEKKEEGGEESLIWMEAMFPIQSIEVTDVTIMNED